jgi:hypothetical protein
MMCDTMGVAARIQSWIRAGCCIDIPPRVTFSILRATYNLQPMKPCTQFNARYGHIERQLHPTTTNTPINNLVHPLPRNCLSQPRGFERSTIELDYPTMMSPISISFIFTTPAVLTKIDGKPTALRFRPCKNS